MKLEGIHHITAITGDAPRNVDFYARVLGLRLVKKTVNQDDPTVYHLFYGDEHGDPGLDLTFFEYPGVAPGRPGAGMVHRIVWRVASPEAIDFWAWRLGTEGVDVRREDDRLHFSDPESLDHELRVDASGDEALTADHAEALRTAILEAAPTEDALPTDQDEYGQRYVLDFTMNGPAGQAGVRSSWIVRSGEDFARLTSCYVL